jgi:hypothetical protein
MKSTIEVQLVLNLKEVTTKSAQERFEVLSIECRPLKHDSLRRAFVVRCNA